MSAPQPLLNNAGEVIGWIGVGTDTSAPSDELSAGAAPGPEDTALDVVGSLLLRLADFRAEYLPGGSREQGVWLEAEVSAARQLARILSGDTASLHGWCPSWVWPVAESAVASAAREAIAAAEQRGREAATAEIVAWLRDYPPTSAGLVDASAHMRTTALKIEAGAHHDRP